eukprot:11770005-Prorocentrum_lima.AAC.1
MKNFLHLRGTTLKAGQKSEAKDPKPKAIQHHAKGISGMNMEVHAIPERDRSQCTREHVLNQLEALS